LISWEPSPGPRAKRGHRRAAGLSESSCEPGTPPLERFPRFRPRVAHESGRSATRFQGTTSSTFRKTPPATHMHRHLFAAWKRCAISRTVSSRKQLRATASAAQTADLRELSCGFQLAIKLRRKRAAFVGPRRSKRLSRTGKPSRSFGITCERRGDIRATLSAQPIAFVLVESGRRPSRPLCVSKTSLENRETAWCAAAGFRLFRRWRFGRTGL